MILGIDPGITGGVAVLYDKSDNFVLEPDGMIETWPMPCDDDGVDAKRLLNLLHPLRHSKMAMIERAQAMPKQGVVSMFNYGKSFGIVLGVLHSIGFDVIQATPQKWQKVIYDGCPGDLDGKDRSAWAFTALFPEAELPGANKSRVRKPHMGMVEAALIAKYGGIFLEQNTN